jgi:glycosyltransferase involved in cell wall biosynthesis
VSVVMPLRDAAAHLDATLAAVQAQDYPGPIDICLAVAPSTDGTEQRARRLAAQGDRVVVVENRRGTTPAGLNAAIGATDGEVIVRVDGHAELSPGYIRRAVETMRRTGAVNVGGIQRAEGVTPFERAVAAAMTSRFGTGDASFHYGGEEGPTDTVYLGVFDRRAVEAVGGFDETLDRNQDYELNIRLRQAGGTVWFDPVLWVRYRPRGSLRALARQYFDYGRWKREVLRRHPRSLRWRQAAPPALVAALAGSLVVGFFRRPALIVPAAYLASVAAAAVATGRSARERGRLTVIFPTMHVSWGVGFLVGVIDRGPPLIKPAPNRPE